MKDEQTRADGAIVRTIPDNGVIELPVTVYGVMSDEEPDPATMVGEFDQEGLRQALLDMTSIRFGPVDPSRIAFHPKKSHPDNAREQADADVAEYDDTTLSSRWVSGWTPEERSEK